MQDITTKSKRTFLAVSFIGTIFVLAEIIMQFLGKSLCFTEGCKIIARQARYGDISILLLGLVFFIILTVLSLACLYRERTALERSINILLIASLAVEGFLTGYQFFAIQTTCLFCLIVFSFIVVLAIIRLLSGEKRILAGFAALAAVFLLFYLVLPAGGAPESLAENDRLVLFFSKECKYCAAVKNELQQTDLKVKYVDVNGYYNLLKRIGIDSVPTFVVNDPNQKLFLVGESAIRQYLKDCTVKKTAATKTSRKNQTEKNSGAALSVFTPQNLFTGPAATQSEGICREEQPCK